MERDDIRRRAISFYNRELNDVELSESIVDYVEGVENTINDRVVDSRTGLIHKLSDLLGSTSSERRDKGIKALLLACEGKAYEIMEQGKEKVLG